MMNATIKNDDAVLRGILVHICIVIPVAWSPAGTENFGTIVVAERTPFQDGCAYRTLMNAMLEDIVKLSLKVFIQHSAQALQETLRYQALNVSMPYIKLTVLSQIYCPRNSVRSMFHKRTKPVEHS
jgi:hypothetical protein